MVSALFRCFYSFVSQVCYCWWSALFRCCLPGLSCSISIHLSPRSVTASVLSPRSVTAGVRPFRGMQHFYSLVSQVCHCWYPPFSAGHAAFLLICFPGLSLVLPPFSAGHVAFLFICLPCDFFLFVFQVWCLHCCFLPCPLEQVRL